MDATTGLTSDLKYDPIYHMPHACGDEIFRVEGSTFGQALGPRIVLSRLV
jgi:hypothetical protein